MTLATFLFILEDYFLPCLTKKLVGFDCPGCGLQRSAALLLEGNFSAAFDMYPGIYPFATLLLFLVTSAFVKIKFEMALKIFFAISTGLVIIISYIYKMNNLIH